MFGNVTVSKRRVVFLVPVHGGGLVAQGVRVVDELCEGDALALWFRPDDALFLRTGREHTGPVVRTPAAETVEA